MGQTLYFSQTQTIFLLNCSNSDLKLIRTIVEPSNFKTIKTFENLTMINLKKKNLNCSQIVS